MKKILSILVAATAVLLSSCTNEDIPVSQSTTFKIDPSNVVKPFTFELNPGELEGLGSDESIRTRLLVYNSENILVKSETQYLANYASLMQTSLDLANGNYTAVVVTDIVQRSGDEIDFACWELSGEENLTTTKITDLGYIGGRSKILGIGVESFEVSGSSKEINISPSPAGALLALRWKNIHAYSNIEYISLDVNRSSDYLVMNQYGKYDVAIENNNNKYDWRIAFLEPQESAYKNYTNIYGYYFVLPMKNVCFKWYLEIDLEGMYTEEMLISNLTAGNEYYFEINLKDETQENLITYGYYDVTGITYDEYLQYLTLLGTTQQCNTEATQSIMLNDYIQESIKSKSNK